MARRYFFLLAVFFLPNLSFALHIENSIEYFAQNFPHITLINSEKITTVASNGQSSFRSAGMLFPESEADILEIINFFNKLKQENPALRPFVISAGARCFDKNIKSGWSFDSHAQGHDNDIVLNTSKLRGLYEDIDWDNNFDPQNGKVQVWAYAGTPWRDLVNLVNASYVKHSNDNNNYFVPIISPTGSKVTIGGSLASNTHARATSVRGGYFVDTIDAFNLVTLVNNKATLLTVEKTIDPTLFYAIVGSFGRGGIVSAIKINLQLIPKNKVATTRVRKVHNIAEMTRAFMHDRERLLRQSETKNVSTNQFAFLATLGIISDDFREFYMLENNLELPKDNKPSFPLYGAPDCGSLFIYKAARALPKLADCMAAKYLDWHCAKTCCEFFSGDVSGTALFQDQPLNNYIFFQDTFAVSILNNIPRDHQTAHFTLMLKLENLELVMEKIKEIKFRPQFQAITFELQDLLPLVSTKALMAPGYSENTNDIFVAYTISWPVDDDNRELSHELEAMIESELYNYKIKGKALAWLHPLKEFSFKKGPIEFYTESARNLEEILKSYKINDRDLFYSKIHDYLY